MHEQLDTNYRSFVGDPRPAAFSICHSLSCARISHISLSDAQWAQVSALFHPVATNASAEREHIAQAIALLERIVGEQAGTSGDLAENELTGSRHGQLDCIDEATNSTVYLRLLEDDGLLRWHLAGPRVGRGLMTGNTPHNTATIIDRISGQRYAVDSWFGPNGAPPAIVPLGMWRAGWHPHR